MRIRSDRLEATVLPQVGGKIAQVREMGTARDLLVPARRPYRTIPAGRNWMDYDASGMDDCFPNIEECRYPRAPWKDLSLPQMGEWVHGSWGVVSSAPDSVILERDGNALPYRARKTVRVAGAMIELRYQLENRGRHPLQYMWAAHPLIAAGEEFALRIPGTGMPFVTFPPDGCVYRWPHFEGVDLSHEWIPRGRDLKIFGSKLTEGWCELRLPERVVRFEFDLGVTPVVGIWYNN